MQAGKRFTLFQTLNWQRKALLLFLIFDWIPVVLYYFLGWEWLRIENEHAMNHYTLLKNKNNHSLLIVSLVFAIITFG